VIPKVRSVPEKIAEFYRRLIEEDYDSDFQRPEFRLYPHWFNGLRSPQEIGWMYKLLDEAWNRGEPIGTLPVDEPVLLKIAECEVSVAFKQPIRPPSDDGESMQELVQAWANVRGRWKPVLGYEDRLLCFSKMTVNLMDAIYYKVVAQRSGSVGGQLSAAKLGRRKRGIKARQLAAEVNVVDKEPIRGPSNLADEVSVASKAPIRGPYRGASTPARNAPAASSLLVFLKERDVKKPPSENLFTKQKDISSGGKKVTETERSKPGTRFDETKWLIDDKLRDWIREKYPEFVAGDIDFLSNKFAGVFTGKVQKSWRATFRNFVNNEVIRYGYRPGQFEWRKLNGTALVTVHEAAANARAKLAAEEANHLAARGNEKSVLSIEDDF
jgi:hypothetical protein